MALDGDIAAEHAAELDGLIDVDPNRQIALELRRLAWFDRHDVSLLSSREVFGAF